MAKIVDGHCSECKAFQPHPGELVEKKGHVGTKHVGCWNCSAPFEDVEQARPESRQDLLSEIAALRAQLAQAEGDGRLEKKGEEPALTGTTTRNFAWGEEPAEVDPPAVIETARAIPTAVEAASAPAAPRLYPQKHTEKKGPGRPSGR